MRDAYYEMGDNIAKWDHIVKRNPSDKKLKSIINSMNKKNTELLKHLHKEYPKWD